MRLTKLFLVLGMIAIATPALAQDAPPPPPNGPPPPGAAAPGVAGWPQAISDRPYTLNAGMLEIHGAMPIFSAGGGDANILLGGGVSYGISDQLEIGGDYAFQLAPKTDAAGVFAAHALLRLVHNSQMSAAVGASIFYSNDFNGLTLFSGGIAFRYRLSPQLSIFTDTNACGGCINVMGPVFGQGFLAIVSGSGTGSSNTTVAGFTIPAGIAYQANPQLYLFASTVFGAILLSPQTDSFFLFNDAIPVVAGGWYGVSPKLELGASITDDLKDAGNNYFFELRGRVFM